MKSIEKCRKEIAEALPIYTKWDLRNTSVIFDLSRIRRPLLNATSEDIHPDTLSIELTLDQFFVFGEELVPGGASALLCIDHNNYNVWRIDVESKIPVQHLNSSVDQFVLSFKCLTEFICNSIGTLPEIVKTLSSIDKDAYEKNNEWHEIAEYIVEERSI